MTSETNAGWLGVLAALWNADGLEAWIAKLIGVLVAVFVLTALFSLGSRGKSAGGTSTGRPRRLRTGQTASRPRIQSRSVPPKNRKKKPTRVRRYRPRSHSGSLRPLTRKVALKLVETPLPRAVPQPVRRATL